MFKKKTQIKSLRLNTLENSFDFKYESATIYTHKYKAKIKPSSIHSPMAAKIIFIHKSEMTVLLVELPIVKTDAKGNVVINTHTDYKTATLQNAKDLLAKEDLKLLRVQLSAVRHKKAFGATSLEAIKEKELSAKVSLVKFIKKIHKFDEGGGF